MSFPSRVWFHTGDGWASRKVMPPDEVRREIIDYICGDREICHSNGRPRDLMPGELKEMTGLADKLWDACHLFQQTNAELDQ